VLNRHALQVDSLKAANIDGSHPVALGIGGFPKRVNATRLAKPVLDDVLVERVRTDVLIRCQHVQLFPGDKPQERSLAGTHGAIARHCPIEITLYLERYLATVTTTFVFHVKSPWIL
jgi:hypothetical protein